MSTMTPPKIVSELNKYIIGQNNAKKAVAIALRNRWRRRKVNLNLYQEITPKNILMIGPTGVGKTEIAKRLAKLANAPFIKVEATKFTEVGYVGRDVDSIIRDLMEISIKRTRKKEKHKIKKKAEKLAKNRILDILLPDIKDNSYNEKAIENNFTKNKYINPTRLTLLKRLNEGSLNHKEIELKIKTQNNSLDIMGPPGMEEITEQIRSMFLNSKNKQKTKRKIKIVDALPILIDEESSKLLKDEEIKLQAINNVEQNGIVFIDEIDKIASKNISNIDVSRQGVQRDLLPLVEGTSVHTKYGIIKTKHILFIASGAFHLSKPSDLIPELQGRFPIRVELKSLSVEDFASILVATNCSLVKQYQSLLKTEKINLKFSDDGIYRLSEIAFLINEKTENIGARRLYTIIEKLLEDVSFLSKNYRNKTIIIDKEFVNNVLNDIIKDENLSDYIL